MGRGEEARVPRRADDPQCIPSIRAKMTRWDAGAREEWPWRVMEENNEGTSGGKRKRGIKGVVSEIPGAWKASNWAKWMLGARVVPPG